MPDEPDPPRKVYGFKEQEFQRDNAPSSGASPMPTAKDLAKLAGVHHDPRPRQAGPKAGDPHDVFEVLRQNRRREQRHNLDAIEIRKIRSRRKRDFWWGLVGGNLLIIGGVLVSGSSVITVVYGLAGLIIFSIGLSWIMWQVMDRY